MPLTRWLDCCISNLCCLLLPLQSEWLDNWLSDLLPHMETRQLLPSPGPSSPGESPSLVKISAFLTAFARLGYQPEDAWVSALARSLEPALLPPGEGTGGGSREADAGRGAGGASVGGVDASLATAQPPSASSSSSLSPSPAAAATASAIVAAMEALAGMELQPPGGLCALMVAAVARDGARLGGPIAWDWLPLGGQCVVLPQKVTEPVPVSGAYYLCTQAPFSDAPFPTHFFSFPNTRSPPPSPLPPCSPVAAGALPSVGCALPARLLAALSRLLLPHPAGWVRANLPLLELLVLAAAAHLRHASAAELAAIAAACAALGFYPGRKFLRWHNSATTKLNKAFPDKQLCQVPNPRPYLAPPLLRAPPTRTLFSLGLSLECEPTLHTFPLWRCIAQVREAYIALGYRPEKRLYERMEAAKLREHRVAAALRRRQSEALVAMVAAERPGGAMAVVPADDVGGR